MLLEPFVVLLEISYLTFCFFPSDSIALLNSTNQLIALSFDHLPVVICQLAPLFLGLADELLPVSLHLVCVHFGISIYVLNRIVKTGRARSEFPLAISEVAFRRAGVYPKARAPEPELDRAPVVRPVALRVERMRKQSTIAGLIGAGLMLTTAAFADPYNPAERALGGGLVGAGTGAVIGAIAGGGRGAGIGAAVGGGVGAIAGAATTPPRPRHRYYHRYVHHYY